MSLKSVPADRRLAELARRTTASSWEHDLAVEAIATTGDARVVTVNLALADMEHALTRGDAWPGAAVRIALLGGALLAFAAYIAVGELTWPLAICAVGGASAMVCFEGGRSARRKVEKQREAVDLLVSTVLGELPTDSSRPTPQRRRRRAHP